MKYATVFMTLLSAMVLVLGWLSPEFKLYIEWLLLGVHIGIDATNRPFLLITGLVWLIASLYAFDRNLDERYTKKQFVIFVLIFIANVATVISLDVITFYSGFALMSLAAYLLIVTDNSNQVREIGQIYLTFRPP